MQTDYQRYIYLKNLIFLKYILFLLRLYQAYQKIISEKDHFGRQIVERDRQIVEYEHRIMEHLNQSEQKHLLEIESKRLNDIVALQKRLLFYAINYISLI